MEPVEPIEQLSRRHAMKRAASLAAAPAFLAAAGVADAQEGIGPENRKEGSGTPRLRNPVDEYVKPPFKRQTQEPPGLQCKMDPKPDCGEKSYKGTGRLTGRKALVTGGDSGIGRAAAIAFAREGADVAISYLPVEEPDAKEVVALIRAAGRKAVALPGDIREESFCKKLVQDAVSGLGGLDLLVNNAGHQQAIESIEDLTTEQFDTTFKTNVYAPFWITKAAIGHMPPGATIIVTASVEAYRPDAHLFDYAQTKAALVIFTKALAKQLAKKGIRVNAVAPGPIWTPLQICGGQPEKEYEHFGAKTPYGRPGEPVELAPLYVLLASPETSFATGEVWTNTCGTAPV